MKFRVLLITFALFTLTGFTPPVEACGSGIHCRHADRERREDRRYDEDRDERDHEREDNGHCLAPVRGLGTEWIGREGALEAARKDWRERVRYDAGEKYVDMTAARSQVSRCSRVSIGKVAGQVFYRCEILARPCKVPLTAAELPSK